MNSSTARMGMMLSRCFAWMGNGSNGLCMALLMIGMLAAAAPSACVAAGVTGATFLKVALGSRPAAMGEAYVAVAEGPYAMYYNPASQIGVRRWEFSAMHQDQFGEVSFDYFGMGSPLLRGRSAWGASIVRQGIEDEFRTETGDGSTFINQDMAITLGYAHRIFKPFTLGVAAKYIDQSLAGFTATGWAVDVGTHLQVNPRLSLGISAVNIGPKITFIAIGDPLPTTLRAGAAMKLLPRGNLLVTSDYVTIPKDEVEYLGLGLEYRPSRFVALRSGYRFGTDFTGFDASTWGLTLDFDYFGIEYAYMPREKLGNIHRAGLNLAFGGRPKQEPRSRYAKPVRRQAMPEADMNAPTAEEVYLRDDRRLAQPEREEVRSEPQMLGPQYQTESELPVLVEEESRDMRDPQTDQPVQYRPAETPERGYYDMGTAGEEAAGARDAGTWGRGAADPAGAGVEESGSWNSPVKAPEEQPVVRRQPAPGVMEPYSRPRTVEPAPVQAPVERRYEEPRVPAPAPVVEVPMEERPVIRVPQEELPVTQEPASFMPSPAQIQDEAIELVRQKRHQEAVILLRKALAIYPDNYRFWYMLSENYYHVGNYEESLKAVNRAMDIIHGAKK